MSTKNSPEWKLRAEAKKAAELMKKVERFEIYEPARYERPIFTVVTAMDDKFIKMTLPWTTIAEHSVTTLTEFIYKHMKEEQSN